MKQTACFFARTHAVLNINILPSLLELLQSGDELVNIGISRLVEFLYGDLGWCVGGLLWLDGAWSWVGRLWHQALESSGGVGECAGRLGGGNAGDVVGHDPAGLADGGSVEDATLGKAGGAEDGCAWHCDGL